MPKDQEAEKRAQEWVAIFRLLRVTDGYLRLWSLQGMMATIWRVHTNTIIQLLRLRTLRPHRSC